MHSYIYKHAFIHTYNIENKLNLREERKTKKRSEIKEKEKDNERCLFSFF